TAASLIAPIILFFAMVPAWTPRACLLMLGVPTPLPPRREQTMNAEHPTAVPLFAVTAVAVIVDSVVASVTAVSMAAPHVLSRLLPGAMLCLACATLNAQETQEYEYIPRGGATLEPGEAPGATVVPHGAVVRVSEVRLRGGDELIAGLLQYAEAE